MREGGPRDQPPGKRSWGRTLPLFLGSSSGVGSHVVDMWLTSNCHSERPAMLTCAWQLCGLDSPVLEVMAL